MEMLSDDSPLTERNPMGMCLPSTSHWIPVEVEHEVLTDQKPVLRLVPGP
jgi:hypothetical protein